MRYLLDINIISDAIRNSAGNVVQKLEAISADDVAISIITAAELRFGAAKKGSKRLTMRVERILEIIDVLPFAAPADVHYGRIRLHLERAGTPIGGNDLLIAAQALSDNLILVTDNEREFARVPKLKIENWL